MNRDDFLKDFIEESNSFVADMEAGLLDLEQDKRPEDKVNRLFRAAHTIKGTAGFFELTTIVQLTHAMEDLLDKLRSGELAISAELVDMLLDVLDTLKKMVLRPVESNGIDIVRELQLVSSFMPGVTQDRPREDGQAAWDAWDQLLVNENGKPNDEVKMSSIPNIDIQEEITAACMATVLPEPSLLEAVENKTTAESCIEKTGAVDSIRVSVGLLNDLLNIAGEMVLNRNQLIKIADTSGRERQQMDLVIQNIDHLTTRLHERVMQARMQPVAHIFNKMPRVVRDLARKIGKEVDLALEGVNVELDKSIMEALTDPLTHLVRNAIDHGIESPEERQKIGKSAIGHLLLKAYQGAGRVVIDIIDDGAGIDVETIVRKAVQLNLLDAEQATLLEEHQILKLICHPGFSTALQVNDISGRGVGMDVVKSNIEKMGGNIEIITTKGVGTTFKLILPLTMAIHPAIIVEADGLLFALPQANIKEFVLIQPGESRSTIEIVHGHPVLYLRGTLLPLARLSQVVEQASNCDQEERLAYYRHSNRQYSIIVMKSGKKGFALEVDRIYNSEEILVKPLPNGLQECNWFMGTTVLGDGRIAMIIDTENLRRKAAISIIEDDVAKLTNDTTLMKPPSDNDTQKILLFRCGGEELMGLDVAMINRVEEFTADQIERIGSKEYYQFRGKSLRLIRPEQYLAITCTPPSEEKMYLIAPRLIHQPLGILVREIYDIVETVATIEEYGIAEKGIIGSVIIGHKLVLLMNLYELFEMANPREAVTESGAAILLREQTPLILLVEDNPFFARMAKGYLEWGGYRVMTADNGRDALLILNRQQVSLVVSDIEMPIMDGLELVRAIRNDENLKSLPVIALTSLSRPDQREKGLKAGFSRYEMKLDRDTLLESVAAMLQAKSNHNRMA